MLAQPPALHLLSKTKSFPQATAPAPTRRRRSRKCWQARRNQIYTAASYRSKNPGYSGPNRPLCPSSPATFCLRHPTLTCWPFDFQQPNHHPQLSSRRRLLRLEVSFLPPRCSPGQSASPPAPLSSSGNQVRLSPFARPTPLAALRPGCFACLAAPRPCHRGGRSSALHPSHQCVIEAIPTLAAINTPVRLGNPLPLAKHVSSLQGLPRGGGECHPLASPDRLPTHDMTLSTRTHDASSGLHATKATNLCTQLLPRLRGAHGQQLLYSISLTAGPVPWSHCHANVLPPPPDHRRHPLHPSIIPPPRAAPDATPALKHVHHPSRGSDHAHVRALVETSHLKPRGLFRRCYCSGAAVFGHDHRP